MKPAKKWNPAGLIDVSHHGIDRFIDSAALDLYHHSRLLMVQEILEGGVL
jgi:hypothetical protein